MKISQKLNSEEIFNYDGAEFFLGDNCDMDPPVMKHHMLPVLMSDNTALKCKFDWRCIYTCMYVHSVFRK